MFVDTFGGGLLVPFEFIYALEVVDLSLPTAGLVMSLGAATSLVTGPIAGAAVDRVGPTRVVVIANVLGVAGCVSLLGWTDVWGYGLGVFLLSANLRVFWAAFTPLVVAIAGSDGLEPWFGRLRGARYVGLAIGQAVSGAAFLAGEAVGLRLIVATNALTFGLVIPLVALGSTDEQRPEAQAGRDASGTYRTAMSDRANVALASLNVAATTLLIAPVLALPLFILERLDLDLWVPGVATGLMTATAAVAVVVVPRLVRGRRRLRNMQLAMIAWAIAFVCLEATTIDRSLAYMLLFFGSALIGLGEAVYAVTADALPAALAPANLRGRYAAIHQLAWGVSETIAPSLVALALMSGTTWLLLGGLAIVTAAAYRAAERLTGLRDGVAGAGQRAVTKQTSPSA